MSHKTSKTEPCFMCKGTKIMEYDVTEMGKESTRKHHKTPCYKCKSTGKLPFGSAKVYEDSFKMWCKGHKREYGMGDFHDDGECQVERKHHWHCAKCGLLAQVG